MESKKANKILRGSSADYTILTQFYYFWFALLIAPIFTSWGYGVLIGDQAFPQLGVMIVLALLIEPFAMIALSNRRYVVNQFFGMFGMVCHMLMSIFMWFIALESFGLDIEGGVPVWGIVGMFVLILKDIFFIMVISGPGKKRLERDPKKEAWSEAAILYFSAMVYTVFWSAGVNSIPLDDTNAVTMILTALVLLLVFVIIHMSSNVTLFLMSKDGKFNPRAFIGTFATSIVIALIPIIQHFFS